MGTATTTGLRKRGDASAGGRRLGLRSALMFGLLFVPQVCIAQATSTSAFAQANKEQANSASTKRPGQDSEHSSLPAIDSAPLTDRERMLLELVRDLQERVSKLEAAKAPLPAAPKGPEPVPDPVAVAKESTPVPSGTVKSSEPAQERKELGSYTPNLGFKIADTEYGDLNLSIYTYVRYLNQLGLDPTYTDAFGNVKNVQQRQDVQIQKLQMKFLGWILSPKLRYFLYAWTSNANQGQGAQVVLAGNLNYTFNKHLTLSGGIRSLPGTRSVEGNFPFWIGVDSRMIADEFFRPSYTSGIWAAGAITDRLKYQVMVGNNMSTLGVSAAQLDNGLNTFSSALIWNPTGEFEQGFSGQGWGDFEGHDKFSTRVAAHFNRSDESRESQPDSDTFENTQLRLSDGSIIFTPGLFGQGITISDATWKMASLDGGFKYRGYALEGEYYVRRIDNFRGAGTEGLQSLFDHGFQLQGSAMVVPLTLQAYVGHSRVFGQFGDPWDFRFGANWFPFKNKVLRWNTEGLYLYKSPVGYTSVPFAVGGRGWVFHSSLEMAF